ncbi:MAG TPA: class II fumarate hydratase [Candidatus Polarisedimenticolaceae bacterium]|nr:class II fumarate hydratase [Candidatus Polarisedimenticolaceae bacterium]
MPDAKTRIERDTMGEMEVPADAYYGASTQRAVVNFPISGLRMPRRFIRALGLIKGAAATVNGDLGLLDRGLAEAIAKASREVADGALDAHFPLDVFQTGSGTSTNMNANEVIANRAAELLGAARGSRGTVHPNDHVNLGQSSNDVIPTALHLAAWLAIREELAPAVGALRDELAAKAKEFWGVIKTGRTHLQDATPIRMGQVFHGYAGQMDKALARLDGAMAELSVVPLGGTAVGTGINTHPEFASRVLALLAREAKIEARETDNHFQAQATIDAVVQASGTIRTVAVGLLKIANDIRLMGSGPRCGLGELALPEVQPGSSIMPGKVNPVIAESLIQAASQAIAADVAVLQAAQWSFFELNTMLPFAAHNLVGSIEILAAAARNFAERCVRGTRATERGPELVERGLAICTGLVPYIGYDAAAAIAKQAAKTGRTVREIARETTSLTKEQLDAALDPFKMTEPTA